MSRVSLEEQIKITALIKRIVNERQAGKVIYITISGSDLYGFPSEDSDIDWRGCYQTHTNNLLGLHRPREIIEDKTQDIVMFELAKEINLALKSNCNILEHLNAPPIYRTGESIELVQMMNNCITKRGLYNSYRGMSMFNYKKFILQGKKSYKKYLYVFRGLMAGIYALQTGRIQPDINELNKYFKIKEVKELIQMKKEGAEQEEVQEKIFSGELDELIPPLYERIDKAYERSKIPAELEEEDIQKVNKWLIDVRRGFMK